MLLLRLRLALISGRAVSVSVNECGCAWLWGSVRGSYLLVIRLVLVSSLRLCERVRAEATQIVPLLSSG